MKRALLILAALLFLSMFSPPSTKAEINEDIVLKTASGQREVIRSLALYEKHIYCYSGRRNMYMLSADDMTATQVPYQLTEHDPMALSGEFRRTIEIDLNSSFAQEVLQRQENAMYPNYLISDGQRLMGLNDDTGILYVFERRDDLMICTPSIALDWDELGGSRSLSYGAVIDGAVLKEDSLFVLVEHFGAVQEEIWQALFRFDLSTGKREKVADEVVYLNAYGADQIAFMDQKGVLHIWDREGNEIRKTTLGRSGQSLRGLVYDEESGLAYCAFEGENHTLTTQDFRSFDAHAPLSVFINSPIAPMILLPGRCVVVEYSGILMVRDLGFVQDKEPLRIMGWREPDERFFLDCPGIPVQYTENLFTVEEKFAEHMVLQSTAYDIYQLPITSVYTQMKEKGYFSPLSAVDVIAGQASRLLERYRPLLTDDAGQLAAYPVTVSQSCFGYSRYAFEQLGLSADMLPATFDELLDFVLNWQENKEEIRLFYGSGDQLKRAMLNLIIDTYKAYYLQSPDDALLIQADVAKLLDRVIQADLAGKSHAVTLVEKGPYRAITFSPRPDYLLTANASVIPDGQLFNGSESMVDFEVLPLTLTPDTPLLLPVSELSVYVVNPFSKNKAAAETYLAYFAQTRRQVDKASFLMGEWLEESESYQRLKWNYDYDLQRLTDYMQGLEADQKREIEDQIAALTEQIQLYEPTRFTVTPETAAKYHQLLPSLAIKALTIPTADTYVLDKQLLDRYLTGQAYLAAYHEAVSKVIKEQRHE